jgi:hypothetical protein
MVTAEPTSNFPLTPWREFYDGLDWRQGEHVTMIAPTGQGKTTLAREIASKRAYVAILATKKRDSSLEGWRGFRPRKTLHRAFPRTILRPPFPTNASEIHGAHKRFFSHVLTEAYSQTGWTLVCDEVRYLADTLKLAPELETLWLQGRSLGVSVVASTQRPRYIPLSAYDQATHLFIWRDTDRSNVSRLADIGGTVDRSAIMNRIPSLPRYQFIYVNTRTDDVRESKVEL